jgi:hypothetical protein
MDTDTLPGQRPGQPSIAGFFNPSPVYLTGEDNLRVTAYSNTANVTLAITGRILRPNNEPTPIADSVAPGATRTATTKIVPLSEGWLLGLSIAAGAGVTALGATWIAVDLVRGTGANAQLVQSLGFGWINLRSGFVWPAGAYLQSTDGPGVLRSITGSTPSAGADISETVPTGARWELISLRAQLTTSATVANRVPLLLLDDGANAWFAGSAVATQAASLVWRYTWFQGAAPIAAIVGTDVPLQVPINNRLAAGSRIRTSTTAIAAGDQWTAPQYLVREFLEGL